MAIHGTSRITLEDVLKAIDTQVNLGAKRKQDMRSAVRLTAQVIGTEPGAITADPRGIGRRLDGASPISLGLSVGRWANCRSLLRAALKLVVPVMPGASSTQLLPGWQVLAAEARKVGSCWLRLGRLSRDTRQHGPIGNEIRRQSGISSSKIPIRVWNVAGGQL